MGLPQWLDQNTVIYTKISPKMVNTRDKAGDEEEDTSVATLPGTWCYRVSTGTGQPGVSILTGRGKV